MTDLAKLIERVWSVVDPDVARDLAAIVEQAIGDPGRRRVRVRTSPV
jgi:hypothetical protein